VPPGPRQIPQSLPMPAAYANRNGFPKPSGTNTKAIFRKTQNFEPSISRFAKIIDISIIDKKGLPPSFFVYIIFL
jgi:hypothetical protein